MGLEDAPDGFEVGECVLPTPLVPVSADVRERMRLVLAAVIEGKTPESIAAYLDDGFPDGVHARLAASLEAEEVDACVDVLLFVQQ